MRQPVLAVALVCTATLLVGCPSSQESSVSMQQEPAAPQVSMLAENVAILAKVMGDQLRIEEHTLVLLDEAAFNQLGLGEMFSAAGTAVDFAKHSVILLSLGEQPTGGYAAEITDLQKKGNVVFVQATAAAPGDASAVTSALTYPFCAVAVDKLPGGTVLRSDITSIP